MSSKNQVETQFDTELSLIGKHRKLIALEVHIGVMRRQVVGNGKKLEGTQQKRKSATQTAATFNPVTIVGVESQKGVGLPVGRQVKLLSEILLLHETTRQKPQRQGSCQVVLRPHIETRHQRHGETLFACAVIDYRLQRITYGFERFIQIVLIGTID